MILNKYQYYKYIFISFILFVFFQVKIIGKFHLGYLLLGFMIIIFYFDLLKNFLKIYIKIPIEIILVLIFFVIIFLTNIFAYYKYGLDFSALRYPVMVFSFFIGYTLFKYTYNNYLELIKRTTILFFSLFYIRNFIFIKDLFNLFIYGRDIINKKDFYFIANGGHNIECTILVFIAMLQEERRLFWFSFLHSVIFSIMWGSRVGIILSILSLLFWILKGKKITYKTLFKLLLIFIFSFIFFQILRNILPPKNAIDRLFNIEKEIEYANNNIGRLGLYLGSVKLLEENILGYGVSNSVKIMSQYTGIHYKENNVHNIYLQYLLDGGIQTMVLALFIHFMLLIYLFKSKFRFPPLRVAYSYLFIGIIQFTGYDLLGWFFIGYSYAYIIFYKRNLCK